jgi:hypothetical protein
VACGVLALLFFPRAAAAEAHGRSPEPRAETMLDATTRDEARRRFDRGLVLYDAGDLMGALAEFRTAYRLTKHPVVLYNVALVHAGLGNAVEAVSALETLGPGISALGPERAARARKVQAEQLARVGTCEVRTPVKGATIQIDGVDVAHTPAPPLRVTAGSHLLSVWAQGYEPRRLRFSVAGGANEVVDVELAPLTSRLAQLEVTSNVPDVDVLVAGRPLGRLPFTGKLALEPGQHELELRRAGYRTERRRVTLAPGGGGSVAVTMQPSVAGLGAGGTLKLSLSEPSAVVSVDGTPRLDYALGMQVPVGRHFLRVERAGFFDVEREVFVHAGMNRVDATLIPRAEYLEDYVARAEGQRALSYVVFGAGTLTAAVGGAFLIWNQGEKNDAEERFSAFVATTRDTPSGRCENDACEAMLAILVDDLDAKRNRDVYGFIGLAAGAAAVGASVVLFALGDDPARYDASPESDVFALSVRIGPTVSGLIGTF